MMLRAGARRSTSGTSGRRPKRSWRPAGRSRHSRPSRRRCTARRTARASQSSAGCARPALPRTQCPPRSQHTVHATCSALTCCCWLASQGHTGRPWTASRALSTLRSTEGQAGASHKTVQTRRSAACAGAGGVAGGCRGGQAGGLPRSRAGGALQARLQGHRPDDILGAHAQQRARSVHRGSLLLCALGQRVRRPQHGMTWHAGWQHAQQRARSVHRGSPLLCALDRRLHRPQHGMLYSLSAMRMQRPPRQPPPLRPGQRVRWPQHGTPAKHQFWDVLWPSARGSAAEWACRSRPYNA